MKRAMVLLTIIIGAVTFIATPNQAEAADFGWHINIPTELIIALNEQEYNGYDNTDMQKWGMAWNMGLGFEPTFTFGTADQWTIGLPSFYSVMLFGTGTLWSLSLERTVTSIAFDDGTKVETLLYKSSPAFGLSIRYEAFKFCTMLQEYTLYENWSYADRQENEKLETEKKLGFRQEVWYNTSHNDTSDDESCDNGSGLLIGLVFEKMGDDIWTGGIALQLSL